MEEGLGPGVVAAVGELSQEEVGELSLQSLVVGGPNHQAVVIRHSLHVMSSVGRAQPGCP